MNIQALIYDTTVRYNDISLSGRRTKKGNSEPCLSLRQHIGSASGVDQDYLQSSVSMLFCVHVYEQIYDDVYRISFQFMGQVILSFGFSVSPGSYLLPVVLCFPIFKDNILTELTR